MDYKEAAKYIKPYGDKPIIKQTYSITHVQKQFKELYDLDVRKIDYGYKGYRYRKYIEYNVYDSSGKCIFHRMTLKALGDFLLMKGEY